MQLSSIDGTSGGCFIHTLSECENSVTMTHTDPWILGRPAGGNGCRRRLLYFHPTKIVISTGDLIHLSGNTFEYSNWGWGKEIYEAEGQEEALKARDRKLEVTHRSRTSARRVKKMFDFIDEYLEQESKRVSINKKGHHCWNIQVKKHHMTLLKKFYHDRSIKLEDLDIINYTNILVGDSK